MSAVDRVRVTWSLKFFPMSHWSPKFFLFRVRVTLITLNSFQIYKRLVTVSEPRFLTFVLKVSFSHWITKELNPEFFKAFYWFFTIKPNWLLFQKLRTGTVGQDEPQLAQSKELLGISSIFFCTRFQGGRMISACVEELIRNKQVGRIKQTKSTPKCKV